MKLPTLEQLVEMGDVLIEWGGTLIIYGLVLMILGISFKLLFGIGAFDFFKKLISIE